MKLKPALFSLLISATTCLADPVTGWVMIFDGDSDSIFTGGSEATASPVIDDAHKSSMAANIPSVTLADGESLTLTGTVSFSGTLSNAQFRWGLFDGDNPVTAGQGDEYSGFFGDAPGSDAARNIWRNDPAVGQVHPFATIGSAASGLTLTFTREDDSEGVADLIVEFSTDLFNASLPPASSVPAASGTVNGVTYTITENGIAPDTIQANIPTSNAPAGKLFGRIGTTQN